MTISTRDLFSVLNDYSYQCTFDDHINAIYITLPGEPVFGIFSWVDDDDILHFFNPVVREVTSENRSKVSAHITSRSFSPIFGSQYIWQSKQDLSVNIAYQHAVSLKNRDKIISKEELEQYFNYFHFIMRRIRDVNVWGEQTE